LKKSNGQNLFEIFFGSKIQNLTVFWHAFGLKLIQILEIR
jgi:hypothetical protein